MNGNLHWTDSELVVLRSLVLRSVEVSAHEEGEDDLQATESIPVLRHSGTFTWLGTRRNLQCNVWYSIVQRAAEGVDL